jgi:hypothetical protein
LKPLLLEYTKHKSFIKKITVKKSDADGFKDRDGNDKPVPTKNFGCRLERISGFFKDWNGFIKLKA